MNTSATTRPVKKPWTNGEKFLLGAIVALVVLVATGALWWNYVNAIPSVTIPTPALPSPNAYDYFVAAGNAVVDDDKISYAIAAPGTAHTNQGPDHTYTLAEQEALVRENAGALRTLRRGFAYPYLSPPARSFSALFPVYPKFRGMARLLRLQGETEEARGEWGGAAGRQLDTVEMGVKTPRGGPLIGMLVGIACQAIGRRPLWVEANHLSAAQAKAAARRMERLSAEQVPYADVLQEEKWGTQGGLIELFRRPDWVSGLIGSTGMSDGNAAGEAAARFRLRMTPKRTALNHYTGYMDRLIAEARRPYAARGPEPIPNDPVSAILCPVFDGAGLRDVDNRAQNALLLATLALRAYRLEHGQYPAALTALVPAYLSHVPDDPFAPSDPLRYKPQGSAYLLYSVGPDGRDDEGRAILDAAKPAPAPGASSDPRRFVQADSRGDIVAGVNVF